MLRAVEDITTTKKRLTIEISQYDIEREISDAFEKLKRKTTLPGFRTGKAPMELIEKKFGREVERDVLDRIIPRGYMDALKEANLVPIANPVMEEKLDFKRHQALSMTLTVEVIPKIDNLRYESIKVKDFPVKVDESDIESVLQRQQEEKATYEPSEGPVDMSDLVVLDYSDRDKGIDAKDQVFKVGGSLFPGEFSRGLVGRHKGEVFSAEVTFPEDHPSSTLAGMKVELRVTVKDIKKVHLPHIDDELAKDSGFENLGEMKKRIAEEIEKAKKNEVAKIQKAEILRKLIESHEFDVPESLVETETAMLSSTMMAGKGHEAEKDPHTLQQELRPNAVRNVKASLLVETIGKAQGVSVSEEEVKSAIVSLSQRLSTSPESIMKFYISRDGSLEGLKNAIFEDKVLDLILSKAVVEKGE